MTAGEQTKLRILETGLRLWRVDPAYVTSRRIASELGLTHGAVTYHFRGFEHTLKDAIAYYAVQQGEPRIIANLITTRHKAVAHMDDAQRLQWLTLASVG